jgi:hypothetical protein
VGVTSLYLYMKSSSEEYRKRGGILGVHCTVHMLPRYSACSWRDENSRVEYQRILSIKREGTAKCRIYRSGTERKITRYLGESDKWPETKYCI